MSIEDRIGLGFTFSFDDNTNTAVSLPIVDPGMAESSSKATASTSYLADEIDTFLGGSVDPGEISFTVAFHPASAAHAALEEWYTSVNQASVRDCTIEWPAQGAASGSEAAGSSSGAAILTAMNRTINRNELVTMELTIKKSGLWMFAD